MWSKIKKAVKKVVRAVETVVSAAVGSAVGGIIGSTVGTVFGLDLGTSLIVGLIGGAIAGGAAGAAGGIGAGLAASAGLFKWAFERIGTFVFSAGGALGRLFSPFFCPTGIGFFLFTEARNRLRALDFEEPQSLHPDTQAVMREVFPSMRLDQITIYTSMDVFPSWAAAITFRKTIFFRGWMNRCDINDNLLLAHELVHVKQYHQLGFWQFACRYADEVLRGAAPLKPNPLLLSGESLEDEANAFASISESKIRQEMKKYCARITAHT